MLRIAVVCDVGIQVGAGHFSRCRALVDKLRTPSGSVGWFAPVGEIGWLARSLPDSDELIEVAAAQGLKAGLAGWDADLVIVDSYLLPADLDVKSGNPRAIVVEVRDAVTPRRAADLVLEPGFGSVESESRAPILRGPEYVLLRSGIVRRRSVERCGLRARSSDGSDDIGILLGGANTAEDSWLVARVVAEALPSCVLHVNLPRPDGESPSSADGRIAVHPRGESFWDVLCACGFVVSAAGVSAWELACLEIPSGLLLVADNQSENYWGMTRRGWALGLGTLRAVRQDAGFLASGVAAAIADPAQPQAMASRGAAAVDGMGAVRVSDAIRHLLGVERSS